MATAPTAGYIYFVESENGTEDWITDHSGDPDLMDLDSFTAEGTDWCKIELPQRHQKQYSTGIKVTDLAGGKSFDLKTGIKSHQLLAEGLVTSRANAGLIEKFVMSDRHTDPDSSTFKDYYMVVYYGTDDHELFTDANNSQKHYCKGVILQCVETWVESDTSNKRVQITFKSVW